VYFANTKDDAAAVGFDDSLIYDEIGLARDRRRIPLIQIMREEALAAFEAWKVSPNRVEY
jgi:guanine deaminase